MKDFAKSIRTNNSVPGSWVKTSTVDGPAQEKKFNKYSLIVQEDKDEERGKTWWSWYVYRGNSEIASGESNSENEAKSKAESWLEHSVPMPTGNSKVGNMDAFLSNAETFAKEWIKEVDKAAKEENLNKLTGLLNSAEAKIKELEKFGEEKFAEYKKASELVPKFREIAFYAKSDIGLLKSK